MSARVLVIEDNPASLDLMVYLLRAFGHTPLLARDGLQGIEVARTETPDLILCDIQLPGADGIEVCKTLKQDSNTRTITLVAVTAYAMVGDREKLLAHGFNGYLSKPINPQTFMEQLAPYLAKTKMPRTNHLAGAERVAPIQTSGTILVVDNSPVNISLSRSILEPFGYQIIEAKSADEALEVLRKQTPDLILSDLHMPKKDGFDFITAVKADAELKDIPFMFISSTLWAEREREHGLALGATKFVVRPIEPQALISEIEACRRKAKVA
ncbi:MAG: response regulator [Pyrinomonadaceae bacterium]